MLALRGRTGEGVDTEIGGDLVGFNWVTEGGIERARRRGGSRQRLGVI